MTKLERIQKEAQETANRLGITQCVINLNKFSPLYVIRTHANGVDCVSIHEPIKKGFDNMLIRFFKWNDESPSDDQDFVECDEADFLTAEGVIEYKRHTVFENGVEQICLTKNPFANC